MKQSEKIINYVTTTIIIVLDENYLRTTILSLIAIISETIYRPAKFVIVTGLGIMSILWKCLAHLAHNGYEVSDLVLIENKV